MLRAAGVATLLLTHGVYMLHYSANTGISRSEPRRHTADEVLRLVSRMHEPGSHLLPVVGYRSEVVRTRFGCFCLFLSESSGLPLASVAVAEDRRAADELWPHLLRYYQSIKDCLGLATLPGHFVKRPTCAPWYATLMLLASPDEVLFLGDFCRHFAWGWVDRQRVLVARSAG